MTNRDETLSNEQVERWIRQYEWEIHDAALLFIDIDPQSTRGQLMREVLIDKHCDGAGFEQLTENEKAQLAVAQEVANLAYSAHYHNELTIHDHWEGSTAYGHVATRKFLIWASDRFKREPPEALATIIADVKSRPELEQEVKRLTQECSELKAEVAKAGSQNGAEVTAQAEARYLRTTGPSEKPLGTRERETLLKLVIGMAVKGFDYDPSASRSDAVAQIKAALEGVGISISDDTIRDKLKEAASFLNR